MQEYNQYIPGTSSICCQLGDYMLPPFTGTNKHQFKTTIYKISKMRSFDYWYDDCTISGTLQATNISHLWKRKIIDSKLPTLRRYISYQEGTSQRVPHLEPLVPFVVALLPSCQARAALATAPRGPKDPRGFFDFDVGAATLAVQRRVATDLLHWWVTCIMVGLLMMMRRMMRMTRTKTNDLWRHTNGKWYSAPIRWWTFWGVQSPPQTATLGTPWTSPLKFRSSGSLISSDIPKECPIVSRWVSVNGSKSTKLSSSPRV